MSDTFTRFNRFVPASKYSRREFLDGILAGAAVFSHSTAGVAQFAQKADGDSIPVTGNSNQKLKSFDDLMTTFVEEHHVPGAALAISKNSRVVYSRGFGYADVDKKEQVRPQALFRIASVSKPITAVAVLQLVEKGKLKLDGKILDYLKNRPGAGFDARWEKVTIRQLLQHTGGWDRAKSFDPISRPREIAKTLNIRLPVRPAHIVQYMMGKPFDFEPGERHAYSNFGYILLGRAIETVTGQPYESHVRKEVLAPLGIRDVKLGRALLENRAKGEVRYYDSKKRTGSAVVGPSLGKTVPAQYGADNFEAFEAHGGWIASAIDLVRFASAFDNPARCPILKEKSIQTMFARPDGPPGLDKDGKPLTRYYGCGWSVVTVGNAGKANTWHTGLIGGSSALLVRRGDRINWAVLFNTDRNPEGKVLSGLIDPLVHQAADKVKSWPQ